MRYKLYIKLAHGTMPQRADYHPEHVVNTHENNLRLTMVNDGSNLMTASLGCHKRT